MKKFLILLGFVCFIQIYTYSDSQIQIPGDGYHRYGPNSSWGYYLKVGGNGRDGWIGASVVTTDGNLHLDSHDALNKGIYLNYYSKNKTIINSRGGNVGIGTEEPIFKLDVKSENPAVARFSNLTSSSYAEFHIHSDSGRLLMGSVGSQYIHHEIYKNSNYIHSISRDKFKLMSQGSIEFVTGEEVLGNTRLVIDTDGNIGIGTTTPTDKLDVRGTARIGVLAINTNITGNEVLNTGYIGSTSSVTNDWSTFISTEAFSITYNKKDFVIGGWSKTDGSFKGSSFFIDSDTSYIGIGTNSPDEKLVVNGNIKAKKIIVKESIAAADIKISGTDQWSDYVFNKDYKLKSLAEVDNYIQSNGHLPDIPSSDDILENGYELVEINKLLLQKIEELTLYTIELNNKVIALEEKQ